MCNIHKRTVRFKADLDVTMKVSIMWVLQSSKGIYLVHYQYLMHCESSCPGSVRWLVEMRWTTCRRCLREEKDGETCSESCQDIHIVGNEFPMCTGTVGERLIKLLSFCGV